MGAFSFSGDQSGMVIGIDLQLINPVQGAYLLQQSDFTNPVVQEKVLKILGERRVDIVLSDMAPDASGNQNMDHERIVDLCFSALMFSTKVLRPSGLFLCKLWQGYRQQDLHSALKSIFTKVKVIIPPASRTHSAEAFLLGKDFIIHGKKTCHRQ